MILRLRTRTAAAILAMGAPWLAAFTPEVQASAAGSCLKHGVRKALAPLHSSKNLWGVTVHNPQSDLMMLRGGAQDDASDEEDEYDEDVSDSEAYDSDHDSDDEKEEEEEEPSESIVIDPRETHEVDKKLEPYDEPLVPSPMISLGASLGVMMLAKRIDLFHPTVVKLARLMFIVYLISLQVFVLYARLKAKSCNDRTPVALSSPLSAVLNAQMGKQSGMMKSLASSLLTSESTVMEYDLKQARSMQSGLLFNMIFMWFLHFKMNQVQPLIIQTITGFSNLIYSPLFQVYVLGRNLERPFKNPAMKKLEVPSSSADSEQEYETSETREANDEVAQASQDHEETDDAKEEEELQAEDEVDDETDEESTDDESDDE